MSENSLRNLPPNLPAGRQGRAKKFLSILLSRNNSFLIFIIL